MRDRPPEGARRTSPHQEVRQFAPDAVDRLRRRPYVVLRIPAPERRCRLAPCMRPRLGTFVERVGHPVHRVEQSPEDLVFGTPGGGQRGKVRIGDLVRRATHLGGVREQATRSACRRCGSSLAFMVGSSHRRGVPASRVGHVVDSASRSLRVPTTECPPAGPAGTRCSTV